MRLAEFRAQEVVTYSETFFEASQGIQLCLDCVHKPGMQPGVLYLV
jgi:hypothetical protein